MHPRTTANVPGVHHIYQSHPHLVRCSGIQVEIKELHTGLVSHQELKQDSHTWLDVTLDDIGSVKKSEVWEALREGMGSYGGGVLGET